MAGPAVDGAKLKKIVAALRAESAGKDGSAALGDALKKAADLKKTLANLEKSLKAEPDF